MPKDSCVVNEVETYTINGKDRSTLELQQSNFPDNPVTVITSTSADAVAILTNDSCPIVGFWPQFEFSSFSDPKGASQNPTCIDISADSKFVITGHEDGTIILWNVQKLIIEKVISRDGPAVTHISIARDNESCLFSTKDNNIFLLNFSSSFLKKDRFIYHSDTDDESITHLYLPSSTCPFCLYSTDTVVNILEIPKNEKSYTKPIDIASAPVGSYIHFSTMIIPNALLLIVDHNETFNAFRINREGDIHAVFENSFDYSIRSAFHLKSGITAAITYNGDINLVNSAQKKIEVCKNEDFNDTIPDASVIFALHERIYMMNVNWLKEVQFISWQDRILKMADANDWDNVFETACSIYEGTNDHVFGIPDSASVRIMQIRKLMEPLLKRALEYCPDDDFLQRLLITAGQLRFYQFVNKVALDFCELNTMSKTFPTLLDYFNAVFSKKPYLYLRNFINIDIYQQFLDLSYLHRNIYIAEQKLYQLDIERNVTAPLLAISVSYHMEYLPIRLWAQFFNDYVSPLIYTYDKDKFFEYCTEIFVEKKQISPPRNQLKLCVLWLLTPINGTFPRIQRLLNHDWANKSPKFIESIMSVLPIELTDGTNLSFNAAVDALLRITSKAQYEVVIPTLNVIFKAISAQKESKIPRHALPYVLRWCFTSSAHIDLRENLFKQAQSNHPDIIDFERYLPQIEGAGFSNIAKVYYTPSKNYTKIIQTMAITPQRRVEIPKYIDEHIKEPEIIDALKTHFSLIVLTDPEKAVNMIVNICPEFHREIMNISTGQYFKYLYLKVYYQYENTHFPVDSPMRLTSEDVKELFTLTCQFEPALALPMLKDRKPTTMQIDKAGPIAVQYRVIDASIHIKTMLGALPSAVILLQEELEYVLVEAIESKKPIRVENIDLIGDDPVLKKSYNTVLMAFDLLSKAPNLGTILNKMWHDIFLSFQLPLWLASKPDHADKGTRKSLTLFFAFFVVEALSRKEPAFVLDILRRDFSSLDAKQMKEVLSAVFQYLDYQKMLKLTVKSLLLEDCMNLTHRANLTKKHAAFVYRTNCVICQQPINGEGGIGMKLFDCGHAYHDNPECGGNHKVCPLCKGALGSNDKKKTADNENKKGNIGRRMELRALSRIEYGLRRHYGKDQDLSESGNYVFFLPSYPVDVRRKVTLPDHLDEGEEIYAFLEL